MSIVWLIECWGLWSIRKLNFGDVSFGIFSQYKRWQLNELLALCSGKFQEESFSLIWSLSYRSFFNDTLHGLRLVALVHVWGVASKFMNVKYGKHFLQHFLITDFNSRILYSDGRERPQISSSYEGWEGFTEKSIKNDRGPGPVLAFADINWIYRLPARSRPFNVQQES